MCGGPVDEPAQNGALETRRDTLLVVTKRDACVSRAEEAVTLGAAPALGKVYGAGVAFKERDALNNVEESFAKGLLENYFGAVVVGVVIVALWKKPHRVVHETHDGQFANPIVQVVSQFIHHLYFQKV